MADDLCSVCRDGAVWIRTRDTRSSAVAPERSRHDDGDVAPPLEMFFDYSSPFAYLGWTAAPRIAAEHGVELVLRPFLLGALFREIGTPLVPIDAMSEAKRRYVLTDMHRWAEHRGVPFQYPSRFPLRTVQPLRMTHAAPAGGRLALVGALMNAFWVEDRDPDDDGTLRAIARDAGIDPAIVDAARQEPAKAALRATTDEAVARGVPGAPTFFVGDLSFWGQDRLELVERALDGWRPVHG